MNLSSSELEALIGGPCSFDAFFPPIEKNIIAPIVPRVAIESWRDH